MNGQLELGDISVAAYFGALAVATGLLFALIDEAAPGLSGALVHALKWQIQTCVPMALLVVIQIGLGRLSLLERWSPWLRLCLSGLLATWLFAPLALGLDIWLAEDDLRFNGSAIVSEYGAMAPPVVFCWLAINAPWVVGFRLQRPGTSAASADTVAVTDSVTAKNPAAGERETGWPDFYQYLPEAMRAELVYLEAELHYLAVVTTLGRSLILYNLRDAMEELPATVGLQTHRSYWVAREHVVSLNRRGRQGELTMSNGEIVPVSRRCLAEVDAALSS
ncbi:MAG: LytTR family DNA-binding domain-containing protein [Pseudomonadota bacterium]